MPCKGLLFSVRRSLYLKRAKLKQKQDLISLLKQKNQEGTVTLVYAARDEQHNSAVALKGVKTRYAQNLSRCKVV